MKRIVLTFVVAAGTWLAGPAGPAFAAVAPAASAPASAPVHGMARAASAPATAAAASAAARRHEPLQPDVLIDLNSASADQLKTLPGIGNAEAAKIIAGRPYLTKAHLVTRKVLTMEQYQAVRAAVIARQKGTPKAVAKKGQT